MKQRKFAQLIQEFPFLHSILSERNLRADSVEAITIKRGDLNLLEVTPNAWAHDIGEWGNDEGYRHFWVISNDNRVIRLKSSWIRSMVPHGEDTSETASSIGNQIHNLYCQVHFIVEVNQPSHDTSSCFDETPPYVVVYKMKGFDWRSYHQPVVA